MNPRTIVQLVEESTCEVILWALLFPKTLWKSLRSPSEMYAYSRAQWCDSIPPERRYDRYLSPLILWLIGGVGPIYWEVRKYVKLSKIHSPHGVSAFFDQSPSWYLGTFVLLLTILLPVSFAVATLRRRREPLARSSLRQELYGQMYLVTPSMLLFWLLTGRFQALWWDSPFALILVLVPVGLLLISQSLTSYGYSSRQQDQGRNKWRVSAKELREAADSIYFSICGFVASIFLPLIVYPLLVLAMASTLAS